MKKQKIIYKLIYILVSTFLFSALAFGKENVSPNPGQDITAKPAEDINKVDVKPLARDNEIKKRLEGILKATTWYVGPKVSVNDGVVFLEGGATTTDHRKWAENLARKTQDVVAVVNRMDIVDPSIWNILQQISSGLQEQWRQFLRALPFFIFALLIMAIAWAVAHFIAKIIRKTLRFRGMHPLLADVAARAIAFVCLILGFYLILQLFGLTTIALTLIGGTGVIGIVLGIAFKNITENLLASILLSIQKPFSNNDLIEVAGITGYVQGLTIRATLLVTEDGHQVQIPNSTVYQSNITNFTKIPKRRESFLIGISCHESISQAQEIALQTLSRHPAVLKEPTPSILVDSFVAGVINIRVYFWVNSKKYSWEKVKSSAIRLIKRAFQDANISMPEPGMNLNIHKDRAIKVLPGDSAISKRKNEPKIEESETIATHAEGELRSETEEMEKQVRQHKVVDKEHNLLANNSNSRKATA
ncbi:mechanosensitive ion channel family protein [Legionella sp. 16cNR16C]|uniref:mechanosensitive ion channel family protein n=1 Tax=Legionella sp. 16cNR16C TaxID=2905656 RepID=UPI001E534006|nr:mechanosensitive ion channel domain-containing protein [Legionella sp. 16cNR16C]MCE3045607.1 mechanosensitive ion channel [Legionella sp. 16cNR16C]